MATNPKSSGVFPQVYQNISLPDRRSSWDRDNSDHTPGTSVTGTLSAIPILIPAGVSFDRIGVQGTAAGSGTFRLGIYANIEHGDVYYPGRLISEFGTVSEGDGMQETTIAWTCHSTDVYWMAGLIEDEAFTARDVESLGFFTASPGGITALVGFSSMCFRADGVGAGSLPDPFTSGAVGDSHAPKILMRVERGVTQVDLSRAQFMRVRGRQGTDFIMESNALTNAALTENLVDDRLYAYPFVVSEPSCIDDLRFEVSAFADTGSGYLGLYAADETGYPRELMYESGAIDLTGAPATKTFTVGAWFAPGLYWTVLRTDSLTGTCTLTAYNPGYLCFSLAGANYPTGGIYIPYSGATLPNPFDAASPTDQLQILCWPTIGVGDATPRTTIPPHFTHQQNRNVSPWNLFREGWYVGGVGASFDGAIEKRTITGGTFYYPISLDRLTHFDQLRIHSATGGDTGVKEVGVYSNSAVGSRPDKFMGVLAASTQANNAVLTFSIDLWLPPGRWWWAFSHDGTGAGGDYKAHRETCLGMVGEYTRNLGWTSSAGFPDPPTLLSNNPTIVIEARADKYG